MRQREATIIQRIYQNQNNTAVLNNCSEIYKARLTHSRSFDINSINLLSQHHQLKSRPQKRPTLQVPSQLVLRQSARRSSRSEKVDLADVVSTTSHVVPEKPEKKCTIRRYSQYEYISSKQKRLDNVAPQLYVYQHSKEAAAIKKKKMNRLKMQYKFAQRSNQKKNQRTNRSKSAPLPSLIKITHKKAKTVTEQPYLGPIKKLEPELLKKIALLCFQQRTSHLVIRRKTCIQETKNSIFVSRDKLLKYHEAMVKKFDQFDSSSYESSPAPTRGLQIKKTKYSKFHVGENAINQFLTPRTTKDFNLISRKASHSVIAQYVIDKSQINKKKSPYESKLPSIHQPSLNEFNQYFLSQKKSSGDIIGQQNFQSKSQQFINKQVSLTQKQNDFIQGQLKQINGSKQFISTTRIKTLPNETPTNRSKINFQQKLKPYLQ